MRPRPALRRASASGARPRAGAGTRAVGRGVGARARLTGLPWNVLGYALTYPLPLMQSAGVLGIYGLTLRGGARVRAAARAVERGACRRRRVGARGVPRWRSRSRRSSCWRCSASCGWRRRRRASCRASRSASCSRACRSARNGGPRTSARIFLDHMALSARQRGRRDGQPRRHHARALAGSRHALPAARLPRRARAIGRLLPPEDVSDHRRAARGAGAGRRVAAAAHLQQPASCSARAARSPRSTTRSTSCRSASICRCSGSSRRSG